MIDKFPPIFDICNCGDCSEIVWGGRKFIHGHNFKGVKRSDINCQNISKGLTGKKQPWNAGENNPAKNPEVRKKISETATGRIASLETIEKLRISHLGKKQSEETKLKRSVNMRGNKNPMFGKVPKFTGKRFYYNSPLQGEVCFRSSYELAYVKYLDANKILWYYEIETFDLGDSTYTPDFFLPATEQFIEIKGYMRKKSQEKINKFLDQYPWDLEILRRNDLIKLGIEL